MVTGWSPSRYGGRFPRTEPRLRSRRSRAGLALVTRRSQVGVQWAGTHCEVVTDEANDVLTSVSALLSTVSGSGLLRRLNRWCGSRH
jgi:hypothetical protein